MGASPHKTDAAAHAPRWPDWLRVRRGRLADASRIEEIDASHARWTATRAPKWRSLLFADPEQILAAESPRGTVLGYLWHGIDREAKVVTVRRLAVHRDWERAGVGMALVKMCDATHPNARLRAWVPEKNLPAQLLLRAAGWKAVNVLHRPDEDEAEIVFCRRPLLS